MVGRTINAINWIQVISGEEPYWQEVKVPKGVKGSLGLAAMRQASRATGITRPSPYPYLLSHGSDAPVLGFGTGGGGGGCHPHLAAFPAEALGAAAEAAEQILGRNAAVIHRVPRGGWH